jgi:hypothetical protein
MPLCGLKLEAARKRAHKLWAESLQRSACGARARIATRIAERGPEQSQVRSSPKSEELEPRAPAFPRIDRPGGEQRTPSACGRPCHARIARAVLCVAVRGWLASSHNPRDRVRCDTAARRHAWARASSPNALGRPQSRKATFQTSRCRYRSPHPLACAAIRRHAHALTSVHTTTALTQRPPLYITEVRSTFLSALLLRHCPQTSAHRRSHTHTADPRTAYPHVAESRRVADDATAHRRLRALPLARRLLLGSSPSLHPLILLPSPPSSPPLPLVAVCRWLAGRRPALSLTSCH